MANTKGKIIIISGLVLVTGLTTAIIVKHYRKKRILDEIYETINDTSSEAGQQALLTEENQLKGSNAFNPNFHKRTSSPKPDYNLLMPTKMAREIATKIYNKMGATDDEVGIISLFRGLKSKGQVSQVASAYASSPLNYGELSSDVTDALTGWTDEDTYITQLTNHINNLPN
jgi:hypothetical protein